MTVEEIRSGLLHGRYQYGEGCLNEPMRIFSDIGINEDLVNELATIDPAIAELAMSQTIERSGTCVVAILERCEDSKIAIAKYLPFLAEFYACDSQYVNEGKVGKGELSEEQIGVIKDVGKFEFLAYEQANLMLDEQMSN
eukprot:CAMPEP_0182491614 /NCGR_PEP_ID=MMETSP1321-20130603/974_1 /TAXON_ID=91990 /ORGANISM="Bolidomonas sp., Strain RCC1657" /LENGTH=139 /DNA_ID=CAMNT_0024693901 /DNA_START=609 /DNA_END=1028 /DNA_ORIENTATION=+